MFTCYNNQQNLNINQLKIVQKVPVSSLTGVAKIKQPNEVSNPIEKLGARKQIGIGNLVEAPMAT